MRIMLAANFLALLGATLSFIGLGKLLDELLPYNLGWAMMFVSLRLPSLVLSPLYSSVANRLGTTKAIAYFLIVAWIFFAALLAVVGLHSPTSVFVLILFAGFRCFLSAIEFLFPSVISQMNGASKSHFGDWQMIESFSLLFAMAIGGSLVEKFGITLALSASLAVLTFAVAGWLWNGFSSSQIAFQPRYSKRLSGMFQTVTQSDIPKILLFRSFAFGLANPLIPFFMVKEKGFSDSILGFLFFALGLSGLMGAVSSKINWFNVKALLILEMTALAVAITTENTVLFCSSLILSSFLSSIMTVHFRSTFMAENLEHPNEASTAFAFVHNSALILGYVATPLILIPSGSLIHWLVVIAFFLPVLFLQRNWRPNAV